MLILKEKIYFPASLRAAESRAAIQTIMSHHKNALFILDCFPHRCARGRNDAVEGLRENKKQQGSSNAL